jgi:hypothetical protein
VPVVKLCAEPRCGRPRLTNHWTARCELHAKAYSRAKDARRSSANPTYRRLLGSTEYQAAKELVRRRDRTCRMADGTCRGRLEVHHRTPIEKGGAVADPANLVLLCVGHHRMAEHRAKKAGGAMSSRRATNQSRTVFPRNKPESSEPQRRVKAAVEAAEEKPKRPERHVTTTGRAGRTTSAIARSASQGGFRCPRADIARSSTGMKYWP